MKRSKTGMPRVIQNPSIRFTNAWLKTEAGFDVGDSFSVMSPGVGLLLLVKDVWVRAGEGMRAQVIENVRTELSLLEKRGPVDPRPPKPPPKVRQRVRKPPPPGRYELDRDRIERHLAEWKKTGRIPDD